MQIQQFASLKEILLPLPPTGGKMRLSEKFELKSLPKGQYRIDLYLYKADSLIAEAGRDFSIEWKYLREVFGDLDRSI